jgi:hypothetical protein
VKQAFDNFFGGNELSWSLGEEMIFTGGVFLAIGIICSIVYGIALVIETINKRKKENNNENS